MKFFGKYSGFVLLLFLFVIGCGPKAPGDREKVVAPEPSQAPVVQPMPVETPSVVSSLTPLESIKDLDLKIESYKTGSQLTDLELEANRKLKQDIIRGTFDIYELCKLALDAHWSAISEKEQNNFSALMTSLLEKKAILSKEQVKGGGKPYKIVYKSEEYLDPQKKQASVLTKLFVPSEKIDLDIRYKLIQQGKGWKIYDVIVDDASLVENYKFQFDTIIKKYGYPELVSRMQKKLKEME